MKVLKIIICLTIGFILGISFMPIRFWLNNRNPRLDLSSSCDTRPKEKIIPSVLKGDTMAYKELQRYFSCSSNPEELLPYAFLMANKYNYRMAYFDVYHSFWYIYSETSYSLSLLDSLDKITQNLALEYLQKAAKLGERNSIHTLGKYYYEGKYFEQDTALGKEMKENAFKVREPE